MTDTAGPVRPVERDVDDDHHLAAVLAGESAALLLELRDGLATLGPTALRALGDSRSHELLAARLAELRPDDAVLSEEGVDDPGRLAAVRVWIVDPLDGTREYAEAGRDDWAVHVALWSGDLVAGAVALPAQHRLLTTGDPPVVPPWTGPPRVVVSRTRAPEWVGALVDGLGGTTLPMGSAGAKVAAVITGDADVYVHGGGQYEWDSAAPVAVARAAGLHCSRLDGSPLVYNRSDPLLPDLVVCRPELADAVLSAVASARG